MQCVCLPLHRIDHPLLYHSDHPSLYPSHQVAKLVSWRLHFSLPATLDTCYDHSACAQQQLPFSGWFHPLHSPRNSLLCRLFDEVNHRRQRGLWCLRSAFVRRRRLARTCKPRAAGGLPSALSASTHRGGAEFLHTDSVLVVDLVGGGKGVVGLRLEAWQVLRGARVQSRAEVARADAVGEHRGPWRHAPPDTSGPESGRGRRASAGEPSALEHTHLQRWAGDDCVHLARL